MKVSVSVMAHIDRAPMVKELLASLDCDVEVVYDTGTPSASTERRWRTGKKAWLSFDPSADWHLVLQDDAVVCDDFVVGFSRALDAIDEDCIVSPYMGDGRPNPLHTKRAVSLAQRNRESWVRMQFCYWGVAVALPVVEIERMVKWASAYERRNYDTRIGRYVTTVLHWPTLYTFPSLVDHREGPSLIGHDFPGRHAAKFLGGSALDVDWTRLPAGRRTSRSRGVRSGNA